MHSVRLACPRCDATLVPAWTGLRCPRLSACGRGGYVERVHAVQPGTTWGAPARAEA